MDTFTWRPIAQLNAEWAVVARSPGSRAALAGLAGADPAIASLGVGDLGELVDLLPDGARRARRPARARRLDGRSSAAVVAAMLRHQDVHPLVPRAIVQALLPGLVGVARRLSWGSGGEWRDGGAFLADAVTTAWEVVVEWTGHDRPYAVLDLLSAVRCRMRRQLLRHRACAEWPLRDGRSGEDAEEAGGGASTDLDELAHAIDEEWGRGLDPEDAAILYAHRVLGYTIAELAELTGRSRRYLSDRRDRAAGALIA